MYRHWNEYVHTWVIKTKINWLKVWEWDTPDASFRCIVNVEGDKLWEENNFYHVQMHLAWKLNLLPDTRLLWVHIPLLWLYCSLKYTDQITRDMGEWWHYKAWYSFPFFIADFWESPIILKHFYIRHATVSKVNESTHLFMQWILTWKDQSS